MKSNWRLINIATHENTCPQWKCGSQMYINIDDDDTAAAGLHFFWIFTDLFSVSSSFFLLLASSSKLCNSAIFSLSDPSWASFNILFSCWRRIKCSLEKRTEKKSQCQIISNYWWYVNKTSNCSPVLNSSIKYLSQYLCLSHFAHYAELTCTTYRGNLNHNRKSTHSTWFLHGWRVVSVVNVLQS